MRVSEGLCESADDFVLPCGELQLWPENGVDMFGALTSADQMAVPEIQRGRFKYAAVVLVCGEDAECPFHISETARGTRRDQEPVFFLLHVPEQRAAND